MTDQAIILKSETSYRIMTKKRKFCPKYLSLSKPKPQFWYYLPSLNATLMRKSIERNTWGALSLVFQPININSHIKFTYSYKSCKWSFNLWYQNRANLKGFFSVLQRAVIQTQNKTLQCVYVGTSSLQYQLFYMTGLLSLCMICHSTYVMNASVIFV